MNNKHEVTWEEIEEYVISLGNKFDFTKIKGVYGIPRGGLVLATLISYTYNIPLLMAPTKDCLIIDDIADSGRTLLHFTENDTQFNKYHIATIFYHKRSLVKPEYYMFEKTNEWIVFPWEKLESEN